jgi:hypothetical protein
VVRLLAWLVIPLAFATSAALARAALATAPAQFAIDLAQPLTVVTAWGPFGTRLFILLALALALATVALGALLVAYARAGEEPPLLAIVACAALTLAAAFSWPCVFSSDTYAYAAYGDQLLHGQNPYLPETSGAHGPFLDAARWQWGGTSFPACVYGPLFVLGAAAAVLISGATPSAALATLRLFAAAAFLVAIPLLDAALRGFDRRRLRVAAFALNPLALWCAAEGHNDTFVLVAVLGGVLLVRRGRPGLGGFAIGLAPLVKAIGLAAGPAAWGLVRPAGARRRFGWGFTAGLSVALAAAVPLAPAALAGLGRHGRYEPQFSLQALAGVWPALLTAGLVALAGIRELAAGRRAGMVWLSLGLWLAIPNPYPWYGLWILPVAVAGPWKLASLALWGATISVALRYLPDAAGDVSGRGATLVALGQLLPLVLALTALWRPLQPARPRN